MAKGSRGEKKIEVIEVLNFRKGSGTGRNGTGKDKELKEETKGAKRDAKHRGRRSVKEKLRMQLMKHYGIALEDN